VHHHNVLRELSVAVRGGPRAIPSMLTVHDFRMLGVGDRQGGWGERAKLAKGRFDRAIARSEVDLVVGVSQAMADRLEASGFRDVAFVPAFAPHPPPDIDIVAVGDTQDVVFAGRLGEDKGVRVLASAFSLVAGGHPAARLVVAGDGPLRPMLERLAARLGAGRVQLLGRLDERGVSMAMARARVVVTPSLPTLRPEGSSLTVVEAALLGRPVVVSDDPGTAAVIERSGGGLVVPAGSIVALASAIDRLLDDADLAAKMGGAARAHALRHHTVHEGVARYRQLYARVISQRRSARR
jgi:glycosyltransferase involved in cell wall biosynthesis